jgi:hypothetical protein
MVSRAWSPIRPPVRAACLTAVMWEANEWLEAGCAWVGLTRVGAVAQAVGCAVRCSRLRLQLWFVPVADPLDLATSDQGNA